MEKSLNQIEAEKNNSEPLYYASKDGRVFKRPVYTYNKEKDNCSVAMGFPVVQVCDWIENKHSVAEQIAKAMNECEDLND